MLSPTAAWALIYVWEGTGFRELWDSTQRATIMESGAVASRPGGCGRLPRIPLDGHANHKPVLAPPLQLRHEGGGLKICPCK